jgi:hypothetical protein
VGETGGRGRSQGGIFHRLHRLPAASGLISHQNHDNPAWA